jgi:hypothetical protein
MSIADNKKPDSMCIVPPTLKELMKKQKALEMQKKERFCKILRLLLICGGDVTCCGDVQRF